MVTVEPVGLILGVIVLAIFAGVAALAGVLWWQMREIDRCGPVEGVPDDND